MAEPDAKGRFSDRGIRAARRVEVSEVIAQCERQRARAARQRHSALSMRDEAHAMRTRLRREWSRAR
jgi:hypothetical protein